MSIYRPEREWPRYVPVNQILVAVFDQKLGRAYGEITNITDTGACFVADRYLEPDTTVLLRLAFHNEPELFVTEAEVVWSRTRDPGRYPFAHGVKFTLDEDRLQKLKAMLQSHHFQLDSTGDPENSGAAAMEDLMRELTEDLDRLGTRNPKPPR